MQLTKELSAEAKALVRKHGGDTAAALAAIPPDRPDLAAFLNHMFAVPRRWTMRVRTDRGVVK